MGTVLQLKEPAYGQHKSIQPLAKTVVKSVTSVVPDLVQNKSAKSTQFKSSKSKVILFVTKEVDMMPAQWVEPGNPSRYELCTTIHTCQRLLDLNSLALDCMDCDIECTQDNIQTLQRLYVLLMNYLSN